jgi:proline dehydrogenase
MDFHIPDFQNTEIAFKHLTDGELYRAWTLFKVINVKPLVVAGPPLVSAALRWGIPLKGVLRATVFSHFCGGETLKDCSRTIKRLSQRGVYSILDYGVEGEKTESGFDAAMAEVLSTIANTSSSTHKYAPFCVFKLTALARFQLLEMVSQRGSEILSGSLKLEWQRVIERIGTICQEAVRHGKLVMIDAEETWIQPAIDAIAIDMMRRHNRENACVYTTIQMYRTEGLATVRKLLSLAGSEQWIPAIKLVRGAYMEKERQRAEALGYPSPIQPDKASTDRAYDEALELILKTTSAKLCAGTHNAPSTELVVRLMQKQRLAASSERVWFAQLLGMSDDLTFNLAHGGFNAAKYVPYGPISAVMPYLFRRAQENTSIAGQSGRELRLIEREIKRRRG